MHPYEHGANPIGCLKGDLAWPRMQEFCVKYENGIKCILVEMPDVKRCKVTGEGSIYLPLSHGVYCIRTSAVTYTTYIYSHSEFAYVEKKFINNKF